MKTKRTLVQVCSLSVLLLRIAAEAQHKPTITTQPVSTNALPGSDVTFSVTAEGDPAPAYQWRLGGYDLFGATDSTLTMSPVTAYVAGDYDVVITNSEGSVTSNVAVLTVDCPAINLFRGGPPDDWVVGQSLPFPGYLEISADGGVPPYNFVLSGGFPPSGVNLNPLGMNPSSTRFEGIPNAPGTYTFALSVFDHNGCLGSQTFTQAVVCPQIYFTPGSLSQAELGLPYFSSPIQASQSGLNAGIFTYGIDMSALPPGVIWQFAPGGGDNGIQLTGIPTTAGIFNFTLFATNEFGCVGSMDYSITVPGPITVGSGPPLTVTTASQLAGLSLVLNSGALTTSGGPLTLPNDATLAGTSSFAGSELTLSGNVTVSNGCSVNVSNTVIISGPLGENPPGSGFTKTGPGTLVLNGNSSLTGPVVLQAGTIMVNGNSGSACFTVGDTATLMGNGTLGCVTLQAGSVIAPGASPGRLTSGATVWNGGSGFDWQINNATGTAGTDPGWDALEISGPLTIAATPANKSNLNLQTLTLANAPGNAVNFDGAHAYAWRIAAATDGIFGFDANAFNLATSGFSNPTLGGSFALVPQNGTNLVLTYTPVNLPPMAGADAVTVALGQILTFPATNLLANDSDPNGDALSVTAVTSPSALGATVSLAGDNITYRAPLSGTSDSFTYTVSDGQGGTATGTVNVTLTGGTAPGFNRITPRLLGDGRVSLSFLGLPGVAYAVDRTFNLSPANWLPQATNPADAGGSLVFTNTPVSTTNNFWRIRAVP